MHQARVRVLRNHMDAVALAGVRLERKWDDSIVIVIRIALLPLLLLRANL